MKDWRTWVLGIVATLFVGVSLFGLQQQSTASTERAKNTSQVVELRERVDGMRTLQEEREKNKDARLQRIEAKIDRILERL